MKKYICLTLVAFLGTAVISTVVAPAHGDQDQQSKKKKKHENSEGDQTAPTGATGGTKNS